METKKYSYVATLVLLVCSQTSAAPVRLKVIDLTGAAFPNVLVIVKSLAGKGEIFRALTDRVGSVPERDLAAGLYRVIATCPYWVCETKISEFLVGDAHMELEVKVDVSPTRSNFAIVGTSNRLEVEVLDAQAKPVPSAQVLVRDSSAEYEKWYRTNREGIADVEPLGTTVTFAVLYKSALTEETINVAAIDKLRAEGKKLIIHLK